MPFANTIRSNFSNWKLRLATNAIFAKLQRLHAGAGAQVWQAGAGCVQVWHIGAGCEQVPVANKFATWEPVLQIGAKLRAHAGAPADLHCLFSENCMDGFTVPALHIISTQPGC